VIFAGVQYGKPPAGLTGSDKSNCIWYPGGATSTTGGAVVDEKKINGVTYKMFIRACPTENRGVWVPQLPARSLGTSAAAKVQELLAKPSLNAAPPVTNGIVNVGMWYWTSPSHGKSHSITAWVPTPSGPAWSTTTATPVSLTFTSGEPGSQPVTCSGPGPVWTPNIGDDAVSPCMYTYRHSSEITASDTFDAQLSIVWKISWTSNVGRGGTLPQYVTTTRQKITVREIQAIVT